MNRRDMMRAVAYPGVAALVGSPRAFAASDRANATAQDNSVALYLYDAFTTTPFSGNPAPIVVLNTWLPAAQLQAFATEMNQSEVAFVLKDGDTWNIRWFTPVREVALNGHATLAAAAMIFAQYEPEETQLRFQTRESGMLTVFRTGSSYLMDFPRDEDPVRVHNIPDEIEADLGVRPTEFWVNKRNILVFKDAEDIRRIHSMLSKTTAWTNGKHVIATAPGTHGTDYVLRYFAPLLDIPEDPVTGVVHCTLVPFWAQRLGKQNFTVRQLSARSGDVTTGLSADDRILIGGPCVLYAQGRLYLS